jgi:hypothetical protein
LVVYVISYGVAWRVGDSRPRASAARRAVDRAARYIFWPLDMAAIHGPQPVRDVLGWYVDLWISDGAYGTAAD